MSKIFFKKIANEESNIGIIGLGYVGLELALNVASKGYNVYGFDKKIKRDLIPAVTHEDGAERLQTVNKKNNQKFYKLINNFYKITNIPLVLNTSLNYKGDPMACSPEDAVKTFYLSGLDELYMGNLKIFK